MTQLITSDELARHLRVHPETIRRWTRQPPTSFVFPRPIVMGRNLRWRPEDVADAEQRNQEPQAAGSNA